jgi:type 1 glutamine amidotransferase
MKRREMLSRFSTALLGFALAFCPGQASSAQTNLHKVLFFSKSSGFEHSVIKRTNGTPSFAEKILADLGPKHGIEFTFSKDGSLFTPEYLAQFDAYFFYTTGDLTVPGNDKNPPMTPAGKQAFLDAIHKGKGFIGTHSASDTFHTGEPEGKEARERETRYHNYGAKADPYVQMLGGEFIIHGKQQKAKMHMADKGFPGMAREDFELMEEWYSIKDFSTDLHVLLTQDTQGMVGEPYQRPPYPATWAHMYGKGRVFYTSMGHREDVWTNPEFQQILFGGIAWVVGDAKANVKPNLSKVAPGHATLPPPTPPKPAGTNSVAAPK